MNIVLRFRERPSASMTLPWDLYDTLWGLYGASMKSIWHFRGLPWAFMATGAPSGASMRVNGLPWQFYDSFIYYTWSVCDLIDVQEANYCIAQ